MLVGRDGKTLCEASNKIEKVMFRKEGSAVQCLEILTPPSVKKDIIEEIMFIKKRSSVQCL